MLGVGLHLPPRRLLGGLLLRPTRRPLRLAGALDRLLVLLGLEELPGAVQRGLGGRGVRADAHREERPGLLDRPGGLVDLRLRLAGQADILARQPLGLLEVLAGPADLLEQPHPVAVRLRQVEPDPVQHLGRGPESPVRGRPILPAARQQVGHALAARPAPARCSPRNCWWLRTSTFAWSCATVSSSIALAIPSRTDGQSGRGPSKAARTASRPRRASSRRSSAMVPSERDHSAGIRPRRDDSPASSSPRRLRHSSRTAASAFNRSPIPDISRSAACCCWASWRSNPAAGQVSLGLVGRGLGGLGRHRVERGHRVADPVEVAAPRPPTTRARIRAPAGDSPPPRAASRPGAVRWRGRAPAARVGSSPGLRGPARSWPGPARPSIGPSPAPSPPRRDRRPRAPRPPRRGPGRPGPGIHPDCPPPRRAAGPSPGVRRPAAAAPRGPWRPSGHRREERRDPLHAAEEPLGRGAERPPAPTGRRSGPPSISATQRSRSSPRAAVSYLLIRIDRAGPACRSPRSARRIFAWPPATASSSARAASCAWLSRSMSAEQDLDPRLDLLERPLLLQQWPRRRAGPSA